MKRIAILYHPKIDAARDFAEETAKLLASMDVSTGMCSAWEEEAARAEVEGTDLVLSVGGDGTILRAARAVAPLSVPIVGINLGKLGFLTELTAAEARGRLPALVKGEGWIDERSMLRAELPGRDTLHALNDIVIARGVNPRVIYVDIAIDGTALTTYKADGVIVASATGSTGYSLAAGGPILYPQARDMVLNPIAPHPTFDNSLVLPSASVVELKVRADRQAVLSVDGQVDLMLESGDTVKVSLSPHVTRLLRLNPPTIFYSTLVRRLVPR